MIVSPWTLEVLSRAGPDAREPTVRSVPVERHASAISARRNPQGGSLRDRCPASTAPRRHLRGGVELTSAAAVRRSNRRPLPGSRIRAWPGNRGARGVDGRQVLESGRSRAAHVDAGAAARRGWRRGSECARVARWPHREGARRTPAQHVPPRRRAGLSRSVTTAIRCRLAVGVLYHMSGREPSFGRHRGGPRIFVGRATTTSAASAKGSPAPSPRGAPRTTAGFRTRCIGWTTRPMPAGACSAAAHRPTPTG